MPFTAQHVQQCSEFNLCCIQAYTRYVVKLPGHFRHWKVKLPVQCVLLQTGRKKQFYHRVALFNCTKTSFPSRVAIFREKNYSTEHGTNRNFHSLCLNSICLIEELKLLRIPFRSVSQKIKQLKISFRTILQKIKKFGILFCAISQKRKTLGTL